MPYRIVLCLLALLMPTAGRTASFQPRIGAKSYVTPRGQIARVLINDQTVATLRTKAGGQTPAQRAVGVKERLTNMAAAGLTPAGISLGPVGKRGKGGWEIRGLGGPLLMVTPAEARAQKQTPRHLAMQWARAIKARLAEQPLILSARPTLVPVGETRTVSIGGAARSGEISVTSNDTTVLTASYSPAARRLTLKAVGPGQAIVAVQAGSDALPFPVSVRRYAAQVSPRVTVRVTGRPDAPAALVQRAIYQGLKHALNAEDGAQVRLLKTPRAGTALRVGSSLTRRLSLRVAGPGLLTVTASPTITVVNQPLPTEKAEAMYYSNNPETVKSAQTLFSAPLTSFRSVRLDYHHMNGTTGPLIFHTDVVNQSARTVSVHVISGISPPLVDTVQVGKLAGSAFLQALDDGVGLVVEVPPHSRVPLVAQSFAPGLTVSGILQMRQTDGPSGAASLSVVADGDRQALISSPMHLAKIEDDAAPAGPLMAGTVRETSPYVFGPPLVELSGIYDVGGQWKYLRLGNAESLKNADGTKTLWGNYGVSYFVSLHLSNPTDRPRTVGVYFAPEAGLAAGIFQVAGESLREFAPAPPPQESEVTRVRLQPGQRQTVRVRTILLNGSAYPASLIIHAL